MGTSRPFVSENKDINKLVQWVIRHFAPINNAYGTSLRELGVGKRSIRDSRQQQGEITYRSLENSEGKFLQPIIMHNGIAYPLLTAKANEHVNLGIKLLFDTFDAVPSRGSESNVHGGLLKIADAQTLGPATPAGDISVSKGTGKMMIAVIAGSDLAGTITITGDTIDRDTGVKTVGDTDTIIVDAVTTDGTTQDSNGNDVHKFTGAYITSKWFTGTVVLSTSTLNLSDVDVYHVSFEQFGDTPRIMITTFDVNLFSTNIAAEFDAYIHTIHVTGSKCNIHNEAELHLGADGETAIADRYWRLRQGNIDDPIDGRTDGFWVDVHYSNSPVYVEDVTLKVWGKQIQILEDREV